jgi:aldehyde:ferredoxin oxidoreductase
MENEYKGLLLRINLTSRNITKEVLPGKFLRKYIGGRNLISYYMLKEIPQGIDAFDEKNKIIIATSVHVSRLERSLLFQADTESLRRVDGGGLN